MLNYESISNKDRYIRLRRGSRWNVHQGFMAPSARSSLSSSTWVCEITIFRSRIHSESIGGFAKSILANFFANRCHFDISFESFEYFISPALLSLFHLRYFPLLPVCESTDWEIIDPPRNSESYSYKECWTMNRFRIKIDIYATVAEAGGKESVCARDSWHLKWDHRYRIAHEWAK